MLCKDRPAVAAEPDSSSHRKRLEPMYSHGSPAKAANTSRRSYGLFTELEDSYPFKANAW